MVETLDAGVCEQIRKKASIVAKYLGNYNPHENDCGYDAFFENKGFRIDDNCSGNYNCNTGHETRIMFKGKEVYHQKAEDVKEYIPGDWEKSLNRLYDLAEQAINIRCKKIQKRN